MRLPPPITSRANARVKALRESLRGEARRPGDVLGLEGPHLIREAHAAGMRFHTVYLRQGSEPVLEPQLLSSLRTETLVVVAPDVFDSTLSTRQPQGIAATWTIVDPEPSSSARGIGLILENIQDPGNLGTLIRSAAAFGLGDVAVTPDSVNPWNPKVVRAAAGTIFRTRIVCQPVEQSVLEARTSGARIFAAVSAFHTDAERGSVQSVADRGVPARRSGVNAAAEHSGDLESAAPDTTPQRVAGQYAASLAFDADFLGPCALLIGNEGAGLTQMARQLADEQVMIPCHVESLNAAVAGSVLMYEVARQRSLRQRTQQEVDHP